LYPYLKLLKILVKAKFGSPLNVNQESVLKMRFFLGKIHSSALVRAGIASKQGIVPVKKVLDALGKPDWNPGMPKWVQAWSEAEELRPWDIEEQER
jgi:hypothetical protein